MKISSDKFKQRLKRKPFLIAVHRGSHGANIIENTSEAVKVAQWQHADIVEIDISKSKDDDFFVFHDGSEPRLLHETRNIQTLTTKEIQAKTLVNGLDEHINRTVETFADFYQEIDHSIFLNIDRSWDYWDTFLSELDKYREMHEYFILKSPVKREYLEKLMYHPIQYLYFPIITSQDDLDLLAEYPDLNLVGFEIVEANKDFKLLRSEVLAPYRTNEYMFLCDSIKLNDTTQLFGGLDDNLALLHGTDFSWTKILNLGINTIQTDWPGILHEYRQGYVL